MLLCLSVLKKRSITILSIDLPLLIHWYLNIIIFKYLSMFITCVLSSLVEEKRALETDFYFAHPYRSCERGLNEHTKGLLENNFLKILCLKGLKIARLLRYKIVWITDLKKYWVIKSLASFLWYNDEILFGCCTYYFNWRMK